MPHDVFIGHSSKDKLTAGAICHALELGVQLIAPPPLSADEYRHVPICFYCSAKKMY